MKILHSDLDIVWVELYDDAPLTGLCRVDGALYRFEIEEPNEARDQDWNYDVYPLSQLEKVKWLVKKNFCEVMSERAI